MKPAATSRSKGGRAFTLTDLMVSLAVVLMLTAIAVAAVTNAKEKARLAQCTSNLGQIGKAILSYAADNQQTLPASSSGGNVWWFYKEDVKGYAGLKGPSSDQDALFACPCDRGYTDSKPFCKNGRFDFNSYTFNGVTLQGVPSVAGWQIPNIVNSKKTLLVMEFSAHAPLSWHFSKTGKENSPFYCDAQSVLCFIDGHVSFSKIYYDGYNAAFTQDPIPGYDYKYSGN